MEALIATDGSHAAVVAAHQAVDLLPDGIDIHIVYVVAELEDPMEMAGGFEGPLITEEEADAEHSAALKVGREALEATARAVAGRASIETIESDDPGRAICDLAASRGVDVLVVGGSDKGWFRRLVSGSVMEHVTHHAPCPVLVVRDRTEP